MTAASADTASLSLESLTQPRPAVVHEHAWMTRSRHVTSEGTLRYVQCAACGVQRVDLQAVGAAAPSALSRAVDPPDAARGLSPQ